MVKLQPYRALYQTDSLTCRVHRLNHCFPATELDTVREMEAEERPKLKSTHVTRPVTNALPPGWTEHTAPTGHKYYYHKETKKSTYTRPSNDSIGESQSQPAPIPAATAQYPISGFEAQTVPAWNGIGQQGALQYPASVPITADQLRKFQPQDRPKRKEAIRDCEPWILVYTRLRRRFVHNTQTKQSFWKFPDDVMAAVIKHDATKDNVKSAATGANETSVSNARQRRSASMQREDEAAMAREMASADDVIAKETQPSRTVGNADREDMEEDVVYEEVEVTDSEDDMDTVAPDKEPRDAQDELDEDDFAYQLQAMEQYSDVSDQDDQYSDDDRPASDTAQAPQDTFFSMLDEWKISPYARWESILDPQSTTKATDGTDILSDRRFTVLSSARVRKEAFDEWSRQRIADRKVAPRQPQHDDGPDVKTLYLNLLATHAMKPQGLYWPEFKRKYKREAAMQDKRLDDKIRESLYREHMKRLKLPSSQLEADLVGLCQSLLNAGQRLDSLDLPRQLTGDLRYISLIAKVRNAVISSLSTTP